MNIIIVGGGKVVHFLTKSFISKGYSVTIINEEKEYCKKLARMHKATIINGEGTRPYILEDAGIHYCDIVIALTRKDPDNLVVCQIAEKIYKVKKTFAIVNDPENIDIFKQLGVNTVISTANIISSLIEQKVASEEILNILPIEEGKLAIMEIEVYENYPIINKRFMDIDFPKDSLVGCIIRKEEAVIPRGDTTIEKGDKLIVLSLAKAQSEALKVVRGKVD
ncbi:potassium channel family protein [Tepidibacter mesophilus]|uniref:potassium channel family protein n=1 Tax=Tepidibacter mesophilus TaxID=655607 RepID=UPI000C074CF9|nr:NAD-binding protein [Tepidibacter mesophilus]